ncbi:hypothetical protein D3C81_1886630 [compost metagenome]
MAYLATESIRPSIQTALLGVDQGIERINEQRTNALGIDISIDFISKLIKHWHQKALSLAGAGAAGHHQ